MKKSLILALAAAAACLTACSDDRAAGKSGETWRQVADNQIAVNNSVSELGKRVISAKKGQEVSSLRELANIKPMSLGGETLSATSVQAYGNYAVVTYHNHSEKPGGGVDLLDISDVTNPVLLSSLSYADRDVNHVVIRSNHLGDTTFYMLADDAKKGKAYVVEGLLKNGQFASSGFREMPLVGSSSNNAQLYELYLFAGTTGVGGAAGAFQRINLRSGTVEAVHEVDRAHHIDINGSCMATLALSHAGEATLSFYSYTLNLAAPTTTTALGAISTIDGKNVVRLRNGLAYVALSDGGWAVVDPAAKAVKHRQERLPGSLVNGLDVSNSHVFVSHGSEGLLVYDKKTYAVVGRFSSNGGSANYCSLNQNQTLLLAANGTGGTKLIALVP